MSKHHRTKQRVTIPSINSFTMTTVFSVKIINNAKPPEINGATNISKYFLYLQTDHQYFREKQLIKTKLYIRFN